MSTAKHRTRSQSDYRSAQAGENPIPQPELQPPSRVIAPTDLAIYPGQILALLGPFPFWASPTLLRMFDRSISGQRRLRLLARPSGRLTKSPNVFHRLSKVFALFPWLTVLENVEAPPRGPAACLPSNAANAPCAIIDAVRPLTVLKPAYPKELFRWNENSVSESPGLSVVEPEVLFMDEPFSAL